MQRINIFLGGKGSAILKAPINGNAHMGLTSGNSMSMRENTEINMAKS